MNELALFAGAGGGILGGKLLGWRTVCAVEINEYARSVLIARQDDGCLPAFPVWDDVRTFDGKPWRGVVDIVTGGFPCQDISAAGKGAGIEGERSGLWGEMARIIREVGPLFVLVENSPVLTSRGLGTVLGDLASMGYDARWGVLGACNVAAPHDRFRIWVVGADASRVNWNAWDRVGESGERRASQPTRGLSSVAAHQKRWGANQWFEREPRLERLANGVANRTHRLEAAGNGQVPAVVRLAWRILAGGAAMNIANITITDPHPTKD